MSTAQEFSDAVDRVAAFLEQYPHDGSSNIDAENIYTFNLHTLRWSDLRLIVDSATGANPQGSAG